jgi:alkylated DNA repair protein alkB homolog 1
VYNKKTGFRLETQDSPTLALLHYALLRTPTVRSSWNTPKGNRVAPTCSTHCPLPYASALQMQTSYEPQSSISAFRQIEKLYKRQFPPPTYASVMYFHDLSLNTPENARRIHDVTGEFIGRWEALGRQMGQLKAFRISDRPGFLLIVNAFTIDEQKYWIRKCLDEYTKWDHPTNLSNMILSSNSTMIISSGSLWNWTQTGDNDRARILRGLRWTTLGYHYDWTRKIYRKDHWTPFPSELSCLARLFVETFSSTKHFIPEAAIINYYQPGDTLMCHCDTSEELKHVPLLSLSFGLDAIFLLGGVSKDDVPTALRLQSGDIMIMEKEARLCYHGVPRIIGGTLPGPLLTDDNIVPPVDWTPFANYLKTSRINLNIRQVWEPSASMQTS